jgi:CRISPR system Cascade subunit CasA
LSGFNLISHPWIPTEAKGLVSIQEALSDMGSNALAGNAIENMAVFNLLMAIGQSAYTPDNSEDWASCSLVEFSSKCLSYLDANKDLFFLRGKKPFLQFPELLGTEQKDYAAFIPEISYGNNTVLTSSEVMQEQKESDLAMLLTIQMGFALGGKKVNNKVSLSSGYIKTGTGKPGPSMGRGGYLHTHWLGDSIIETLRFNLLTHEDIAGSGFYPEGLGVAPWEKMPSGENCDFAQRHKKTLMGRLVPLCRFAMLTHNGICITEGINHEDFYSRFVDPSMSVDFTGKKPKALYADPGKRPWRELTSLLSFIAGGGHSGHENVYLKSCIDRVKASTKKVRVWSGGLRVSFNAGEQFTSGTDDYVLSSIDLYTEHLGESWFFRFKKEISDMEDLQGVIKGSVTKYCLDLNRKRESGAIATKAVNQFWDDNELALKDLTDLCGDFSSEKELRVRQKIARNAIRAFNCHCPQTTARLLDAWAANKVNPAKYLAVEKK